MEMLFPLSIDPIQKKYYNMIQMNNLQQDQEDLVMQLDQAMTLTVQYSEAKNLSLYELIKIFKINFESKK